MSDYNVAMNHPVSIRFRDERVMRLVKAEAKVRGKSTSALAEELIDEALRMRRHPLITFRDNPAGRRPVTVDGPEVWEIVGAIVGSDLPAAKRIDRVVDEFGYPRRIVEAAMAYYAEYTEEIDAWLAANAAEAEEAEALWRRQRDLLAR